MQQLKRCELEEKSHVQGSLPEELLIEILQRLRVPCLLRFQRVSKSWQSLITDPSFKLHPTSAGSYSFLCHSLRGDPYDPDDKLYRVKFERFETNGDDHHHVVDRLKMQLHMFDGYLGLGSSNGLICCTDFASYCYDFLLYLWNPSINRYKKVSFGAACTERCPSKFRYSFHKMGFGFCGINGLNDYKLVHVGFHYNLPPASCAHSSHCPGHVNVYSLASDSWKSLTSASVNVPSHLAAYTKRGDRHRWGAHAFVRGVYYWLLSHGHDDSYSLVAFDLANEVFLGNKVEFPKLFRPSCVHRLYLFEMGESVALYEAVDEFRKGCLWISTTESINDCNSGKLTWIELFSVVVDDAKELLTDKRIPYSLQMMLKYHENIEKLDPYEYCHQGVSYYAEKTTYFGTYIKSLALLGMASQSLPSIIDYELDAEDYAYIYAVHGIYEDVDGWWGTRGHLFD